MKIAKKLPVVLIALAAATGVVLGAVGYFKSSGEIVSAAESKLEALLEARKTALEDYLKSVADDVVIMSENAMITEETLTFQYALEFKKGGAETIRKLYIEENPEPNAKEKLDKADGSRYSKAHGRVHPIMRRFAKIRGYEDAYLIDATGLVVYSVYKGDAFGTNMIEGPYKETDLAALYRTIKEKPTKGVALFSDFKPYAPSNGAPASFIAAALLDGEEFLGAVVFQISAAKINNVMQQATGLGETGETYLVGRDYLMRSDSRFSKEPTLLKVKIDSDAAKAVINGEEGLLEGRDYHGDDVLTAFRPLDFLGVRWGVMAEIDQAEVLAPLASMRNFMIVACLIVIAIASGVGVAFGRGVAGPIARMTSAMGQLAGGDTTVEIPAQGRSDEIGEMADAVQVFKDSAIEMKRLEEEKTRSEAKAAEEKKALMAKLADDFQASVGGVVESVSSASTQMQSSAESMSATATETNTRATMVAAASEQATSNVETVAAAAEQLSSSIGEISRQVSESTRITAKAVEEAQRTNDMVKGLSNASQKIGEVVSLITDIAEQTNLLALNATIEAARAGDAGKGFAVVASEVKNLANQTAKATEEIAAQIGNVQGATDDSVKAIGDIGNIIGQVNEIASAIAAAVEQQGAATQEIARNVEQAAAGTHEVSSNIASVTQAAGESGQAAGQMLSAAKELSIQAETLSVEVDKFLVEIRRS